MTGLGCDVAVLGSDLDGELLAGLGGVVVDPSDGLDEDLGGDVADLGDSMDGELGGSWRRCGRSW